MTLEDPRFSQRILHAGTEDTMKRTNGFLALAELQTAYVMG